MRLIDGDALYKAMQDAEDLARQRVLDTESTLPYPNNLNPSYTRYLAQMDERTKAKEMVADAPTVDAVPARHGRWIYEERDRLDHETDDGRVFRTEKWWKCSECGNAKGYIGHKPSDNFCSKCGADMRKGGDTDGV